ncbi:Zinc finger ZPR1-type [Trinorchestia longiramus]|nr:Zinc finger ZPR1-type [Trinorchestia longiramus]
MASEENIPQPIFLDLATESEEPTITEISSVCLQCHEQGTTRLLLTMIPFFKKVMVSSFSCPHCHYSNNSLLNVGRIQDSGIKYTLNVRTPNDLRRMVVRSDYATISIPQVELEVVPGAGTGEVTNVEGVVKKVLNNLQQDQPMRREADPDGAEKIQEFINKLTSILAVREPFTVQLEDPSGNSFIERLKTNGLRDTALEWTHFRRTAEQDEMLGISSSTRETDDQKQKLDQVEEEEEGKEEHEEANDSNAKDQEGKSGMVQSTEEASRSSAENNAEQDNNDEEENLADEVLHFSELCDRCQRPAHTNMKVTGIPHFKEVVIMATVCDYCGNRTSEVKSGGGISPCGRRIVLRLEDPELDMARDVLKSETCDVQIPELELHVGAGILGGKFTTLEGLLVSIKEDMSSNPFFVGDSVEADKKAAIDKIFKGIDQIISGEFKATFIMDDPTGNSYLQNVYAPDPDPCLEITEYERTFQQNEELGLNDIKTEGYENDS